jgi:PAS domain S-box-containing protein
LRQTERDLKANNIVLTSLMRSPDPILVKDHDGRYIDMNPAFCNFVGATREQLLGMRDRDLLEQARFDEDVIQTSEQTDRDVFRGKGPVSYEQRVIRCDDTQTMMVRKVAVVDQNDVIIGLLVVGHDVTDSVRLREQLQETDAQNTVLLTDLHHRIKNHLQSLSSLIHMSARDVDDDRANEILAATAKRLIVLARVYDRLQLDPSNTQMVEMEDFIQELCRDLTVGMIGLRPIDVTVHVEKIKLNANVAVSVGLLINELVTNALKHAFTDRGMLTISLSCETNEECFLEVQDDGCGAKPGRVGTGSKLIQALTRQLHGTYTQTVENGTSVLIRFPNPIKRAKA